LENISFNNFDEEVKRRLDKIFSEDNLNMPAKKGRKNNQIVYPIYKLKKIVLNLEWEITDDLMDQYIEQLNQLKETFKGDKHLMLLIKLQYVLGNLIRTRKGDTPHYGFKMLRTLFNSMNRIVSDKSLTKNIKQQIITKELERYHKLKKLIEHNKLKSKNVRRKRKSMDIKSPRNADAKNFTKSEHLKYNNEFAFYVKVLDNAIIKLKRFIKDEIEQLKFEIQIRVK
jgi:hypothetical protein